MRSVFDGGMEFPLGEPQDSWHDRTGGSVHSQQNRSINGRMIMRVPVSRFLSRFYGTQAK